MVIQPKRPESGSEVDTVDASINARLTRHLMDNAAKSGDAPQAQASVGLGERIIVAGGTAFLMAVLGLFSILDIRKRFL